MMTNGKLDVRRSVSSADTRGRGSSKRLVVESAASDIVREVEYRGRRVSQGYIEGPVKEGVQGETAQEVRGGPRETTETSGLVSFRRGSSSAQ